MGTVRDINTQQGTAKEGQEDGLFTRCPKGRACRTSYQGLAQTADTYKETISCPQSRYDQPRLIHQAHVRAILEAAPLKNGSGEEICRLHDVANKHVCALKVVKQDSYDSLLMAIVESKLDNSTMKEWLKYSQDQKKTPPYTEILKFLDLRA